MIKNPRVETVDIVRGIAIILMVYTHFFWYTVNPDIIKHDLIFTTSMLASFYCVPLFYFIVGYALVISINAKVNSGYAKKELRKYIICRAVLIYIFGFVLNLYRWHIEQVWNWGTLHMISLGYLISYILLNVSVRKKAVLIGIVLVSSFMLEPYYWTYNYIGDWNLSKFFIGVIFSGENPVLPWLSYFLMGTIIANVKITKKTIVTTFLLVSMISLSSFVGRAYMPVTKWPASLTYNLLFLSGCVLLFAVIFCIREYKGIGKYIFYPFRLFGMYPLTLYMGHVIIGRELLTILKNNLGIQAWNTFVFEFIFIFIITFILLTLIGHFWEKNNFKYSLEWLLRRVSHRSLKKDFFVT